MSNYPGEQRPEERQQHPNEGGVVNPQLDEMRLEERHSSTAHHSLPSLSDDRNVRNTIDGDNQGPEGEHDRLPSVRLPSFIYRHPQTDYNYPPVNTTTQSFTRQYGGALQLDGSQSAQPGTPAAFGQPFGSQLALQYGPNWAEFFEDSTARVPKPRPVTHRPPAEQRPSSYLAWSIFTMLCCNLLLGLAAVVISSEVDSAYAAGQREDSKRKSSIVLALNIIATVIGVVVIIGIGFYYGTIFNRT